MKEKGDTLYLLHIQECLARLDVYVARDRERLGKPIVRDAVLRVLQIMTESTQRLTDELKARYHEVNWQGMSGFRNVLVHGYLEIDFDKVWGIIEQELPKLKRDLAPEFKGLPKPPRKRKTRRSSPSRKKKQT